MPYIPQIERPRIDTEAKALADKILIIEHGDGGLPVGTLNYALSKIIWRLFDEKPSYRRASALRGVLADVRDEFTRRKMDPYEDEKKTENGDL